MHSAFKLLENDRFIKIVKSNGTFICLPENTGDSKNIYLLVSCYKYRHYASQHSLQIMFDIIAECALPYCITPIVAVPGKTSGINRSRHENIAVVEQQIRQICRDIVSYFTASDNSAEYHYYNTSLQ